MLQLLKWQLVRQLRRHLEIYQQSLQSAWFYLYYYKIFLLRNGIPLKVFITNQCYNTLLVFKIDVESLFLIIVTKMYKMLFWQVWFFSLKLHVDIFLIFVFQNSKLDCTCIRNVPNSHLATGRVLLSKLHAVCIYMYSIYFYSLHGIKKI